MDRREGNAAQQVHRELATCPSRLRSCSLMVTAGIPYLTEELHGGVEAEAVSSRLRPGDHGSSYLAS
jgi:hypothetical protein